MDKTGYLMKYLLLLCQVFLSFVTFADNPSLEQKIQASSDRFGAESVSVYYEDYRGKIFTQNPDTIYHAASTMKVPVMMEVFRQVEAGKLTLDQPVVVKNEFASIMDGSSYSLTAEEDSDTEIYKMIGKTLTLRELVQRMINQSSNLSTNLVIQLVSAKNVMELMNSIHAQGMTVLRGVEDNKAYEAGKNNTASARSLAICLKEILDPNLFQEKSRQEMFDILLSQHFKEIGKGIDADAKGLKVASKDGWITEINHDAAIIRDGRGHDTILVIMTRGVKEEKEGEKLISTLAADIWNELQ
jgi:beta-lactamase class A